MDTAISVKEASKIQKLSTNRIYQLIHENKIDLVDGKPSLESTLKYKKNRNPRGRPQGISKEVKKYEKN